MTPKKKVAVKKSGSPKKTAKKNSKKIVETKSKPVSKPKSSKVKEEKKSPKLMKKIKFSKPKKGRETNHLASNIDSEKGAKKKIIAKKVVLEKEKSFSKVTIAKPPVVVVSGNKKKKEKAVKALPHQKLEKAKSEEVKAEASDLPAKKREKNSRSILDVTKTVEEKDQSESSATLSVKKSEILEPAIDSLDQEQEKKARKKKNKKEKEITNVNETTEGGHNGFRPEKAPIEMESEENQVATAAQVDVLASELKEESIEGMNALIDDYAIEEIRKVILDVDFFDNDDTDECLERYCENLQTTLGYCRYHYIKNWKSIRKKKEILKEGKLHHLIEELVVKYPVKYIEAMLKDLSGDKEFVQVLKDLNIESTYGEDEVGELDLDDDISVETRGYTTPRMKFEEEEEI